MRVRLTTPGPRALAFLLALGCLGAGALYEDLAQSARAGVAAVAFLSEPAHELWSVTQQTLDNLAAPTLSLQQQRELIAEVTRLRGELAATATRIVELNGQIAELSDSRVALGSRSGELIPAIVTAVDGVGWRDSISARPQTSSVPTRRGDLVASVATLDAGSADGVRDGLAVLLGGVAIGTVDSASTYSCRVRLFSDPASLARAQIVRLTEQGVQRVHDDVRVQGLGQGAMHIRELPTSAGVAVGDLVLTPIPGAVQASLQIGQIAATDPDPKNRQLLIARVAPGTPYHQLRRVYVYRPGRF